MGKGIKIATFIHVISKKEQREEEAERKEG